ncbi:MAG TPA: hypothetical protein VI583_13160, partial [Cyclobacteriaceae bacterium]|nr:hypothetical protein [Cyclobacteriaceae bacterium]
MKKYKVFRILAVISFSLIISSAVAQEFLTPVNGLYGGRIRNFTYIPTGSLYSGLYGSTDGGIYKYDEINDTWEIRPNPGYYFTGYLADDNIGTLYLANYSTLRISDDGFETWVDKYYDQVNYPNATSVFVSPTTGTIFIGTYNYGIYRSEDDGDNWTQITTESSISSFDLTTVAIYNIIES